MSLIGNLSDKRHIMNYVGQSKLLPIVYLGPEACTKQTKLTQLLSLSWWSLALGGSWLCDEIEKTDSRGGVQLVLFLAERERPRCSGPRGEDNNRNC